MFAAIDGKFAGVVAVADTIKPESKEAIRALQNLGLEVVMMTGDNRRTAEAVAARSESNAFWRKFCRKENPAKSNACKRKENRRDGRRRHQRRARAGASRCRNRHRNRNGRCHRSERHHANQRRFARRRDGDCAYRKRRFARSNKILFWAFIYNVIGIPIAAGLLYPFFGILLSPILASAAMSLSSVSVVANSLRLRSFKAKTRNGG
jgi:Cu+-exporting ATPase